MMYLICRLFFGSQVLSMVNDLSKPNRKTGVFTRYDIHTNKYEVRLYHGGVLVGYILTGAPRKYTRKFKRQQVLLNKFKEVK